MTCLYDDCDPDRLARALEAAQNRKMSGLTRRSASERIWRAIAAGTAHDSTKILWVEIVAKRLVEQVLDNEYLEDSRRGSESLSALGIYARDDCHAEMRSVIETYISFPDLDDPENTSTPSPAAIYSVLLGAGFFQDDGDKRNHKKVIARELKKISPARGCSRA